MQDYEITEEQINKLNKNSLNTPYLKEWFPEVFEVNTLGKWVIVEDKSFSFNALVYDNVEQYTYGFNHGNEWTTYFNIGNVNMLCKHQKRLATDSEVLEALTNEAKKRGLVEKTYILSAKSGNPFKSFERNYYIDEEGCFRLDGIVIMKDGKWAEIIKTYTKEEAEKLLNAKII